MLLRRTIHAVTVGLLLVAVGAVAGCDADPPPAPPRALKSAASGESDMPPEGGPDAVPDEGLTSNPAVSRPFVPTLPPWDASHEPAIGARATSGERFITTKGDALVIEGIQAPDGPDDGTVITAFGDKAWQRLDQLIKGVTLRIEMAGNRVLPNGDRLAQVSLPDGRLVAATMLEEGLVRLALEPGAMRDADLLRAAQARAQAAKVGVWARPVIATVAADAAFHAGIGLGMFAHDDGFDYSPFLDEIKAFGASHIVINVPHLMYDYVSLEFGPVEGRTASWGAVTRVARAASDRGLATTFFPAVLLRTGTIEHWRGNIDPKPEWIWFRNYGRYISKWADLARELGVPMFCVGSEFTTMEKHTEAWRVIIDNVRSRYPGRLTYSANWDTVERIQFWDQLDAVGMTGYHSLTKVPGAPKFPRLKAGLAPGQSRPPNSEDGYDDPTDEELLAAWIRVRTMLLELQKTAHKPLLFMEIGYPAQTGANTDPWNYFINPEKPNAAEQAACFKAFFTAWADVPRDLWMGLYVWNWWRDGGPGDASSYSITGKPAEALIRDWYARLRAMAPPQKR